MKSRNERSRKLKALKRRLDQAVTGHVATTNVTLLASESSDVDALVASVLVHADGLVDNISHRRPPYLTCTFAPLSTRERKRPGNGLLHSPSNSLVIKKKDLGPGGTLDMRLREVLAEVPLGTSVTVTFLSWAKLIDHLEAGTAAPV